MTMVNYAITALFWLATATLLLGLGRRALLWRAGRSAAWSWLTLPTGLIFGWMAKRWQVAR